MLYNKPMKHSIKPKFAGPRLLRYANATLLTLMAFGLTMAFWGFLGDTPFILYFAAVALSSWYGGLGPGLVSTLLSVLLTDYFLLEPIHVLLADAGDALQLVVFAFVAFLVSWTENHRLESELALLEARDELHIILNGVRDGITAQTPDGQPIYANDAAAALSSFRSGADMARSPVSKITEGIQMLDMEGNPLPLTALPRHKVMQTRKTESLTFQWHRGDGELKWSTLITSPVLDEQGSIKLLVNIFRDVTEQHEAEQQRSQLAAIVRYSYDAIIGMDTDGIITSWNPGAESMYAYTADEIIGEHISIIFPPGIRDHEMELLDRLSSGEFVQYYETTRRRKDGSIVDVSLTVSPVRGANGQTIGYAKIARDITLRRKMDKLREENEHFLRQILDTLPNKVCVLNPDGILTEINRRLLSVTGLAPEDVIGKPVTEAYWLSYSPEVQEQVSQDIQSAASGEVMRRELVIRAADDQRLTVDHTVSPMFDADGKLVHLVLSAVDITERKQREDYIVTLSQRIQTQTNRLNNILSNVPGIVYEAAPSANGSGFDVTFVSNYVETMTGYSAAEWKSDPHFFQKIIHPDDLSRVRRDGAKLFEAGEAGMLPYRIICKDESVIHVEGYISVIVGEDDTPVSMAGVIMDVTEQKHARDQLVHLTLLTEAQHQRLANIVDNVPGVVYDTTVNMRTGEQRMNFISDYVEKMLGYPPSKWDQDPNFWGKIVHPDDGDITMQAATTAYESGEPGVVQFRCIRADGSVIEAEAFFAFISDGDIVKGYGVIMDITKRKKIELDLARYTEDLKRSNQELEQFAYVASHDLQEPLRKVTSYLQLIDDRYSDQLDQDAKDFIAFAVDGAARMKTLISDLLTFSRVQRSREDFQKIRVQDVIDRAMSNLQLRIEDTEATITVDPMPKLVASDRQLLQLFQNLLSNAIKFRGDAPPCIHIGVERKDAQREWLFSVSDNGIGIESEYLDRIFVIFQRLHSQGKYPGTGIGLAICKKVVENHNGRIWVTSKPGQGTTFYFTIAERE